MLIDVIIPTHNRLHRLPRAIDSVLAQSMPAASIWVIDDGSTDGTQQLISQKYPKVHYVYQAQQGVSHARNVGITHSQNEWIALLDSDDYWLPHKLQQQCLQLQGDQMLSTEPMLWSHTGEQWIRNGQPVNQPKSFAKQTGDIYQACLQRCCVAPSSVLLHRSLIQLHGGFDTRLPACEDYDLWLRLSAQHPISLCKQALIEKYGGHPDQLSYRYWGMDRFRIYALQKQLAQPQLSDEQRSLTRKYLKKRTDILVKGALARHRFKS